MPLFTANTFRTVGAAAVSQNLFSLWNGSADPISILQLNFEMDATAALTSVMPLTKSSLVEAAPGAGIALTKLAYSGSSQGSDSGVVAKGEVSEDGGARTALTGTPGTTIWQQFGMRAHTAVGQIVGFDYHLLPNVNNRSPFILKPNQGILVNIVAPTTGSNPATNHYYVQCAWREGRV